MESVKDTPAPLPDVQLEESERARLAQFFLDYSKHLEGIHAENMRIVELKARQAKLRQAIDHAEDEIGFEPSRAARSRQPKRFGGLRIRPIVPTNGD